MAIKEKEAEQAVRKLLSAMDIQKEKHTDIEQTPRRVVKMLAEVWEGEKYTNKEIAEMFGKTFDHDGKDMVVIRDIEAFSYCEHHLALIYNMKIDIAYIPKGKVIGLSKIARIADMCCKRLQLQERICSDIADVMTYIVGENVCVRISANHSCMTARGIKKTSSKTVTVTRRGLFKNPEIYNSFLDRR